MDCFQDFCLACDRQSTSGPYCSQACRLADLEKAGSSSGQTSPTAPAHNSESDRSGRRIAASSSDRALTMAASARRQQRIQSQQTTTTTERPAAAHRSLSPSSSRSSLSSIDSATAASSHNMSESARAELQDYFSSFSKTRAAKRRQSTW